MNASPSPWIVRPRPNPQAALRLVCFPYAGGGSTVFRPWPSALPPDVELLAVELPGRDTRFKEKPFRQLEPLVNALCEEVAPQLRAPFAMYGHSMGSIVGFAFARELFRRGLTGPVHLFVSGRRAPQWVEDDVMYHLPEPQFLAGLRRLGGVSEAVLNEPELMQLFLPILRADFEISETAKAAVEPPLPCPIAAMGGTADKRVPLDGLDAWRELTTGGFEREVFAGGHFFIQSERAAFLASLSNRLSRVVAGLLELGVRRARGSAGVTRARWLTGAKFGRGNVAGVGALL